jgi:hypothetical protein
MMTLAEHIIEATPDRIKQENFVPMESALARTDPATVSSTMSWLASYLADADHLPSAAQIRSGTSWGSLPGTNAPNLSWRQEEGCWINAVMEDSREV